ncbi:pyridoxamine 5'-phosphate oxidase family protein [Arenimonas alkanexedens]
MHATRADQIDELRQLIQGIDIAMFTTQDGGRKLHSRPMDTQQIDADGMLWFLSSRDSDVVGEVHDHPAVCLTYASREKNTYVCITGKAQEIHDQAKISELWSPEHENYFPGGRDDPALTLLRVIPEHAETWTGPSGTVGRMLAFAVAAITGDAEPMGSKKSLPL